MLSGDDYLNILNALSWDAEPKVTAKVLEGLWKVRVAFVPDELKETFAFYVRQTLRPALERFGLQRVEGEEEVVSLLRPRLVSWLGNEGRDREVRQYADSMARSYMREPPSIDPSLAGVALEVAAIEGNRSLFEAYKSHFEEASVPAERSRFLGALCWFADAKLQEEALQYFFEGPVRPTELYTLLGGIGNSAESRNRAFRWLTSHYDEITARLPPGWIPFMPIFASGCSLERLERARAFFAEHSVEGTANTVAKVADQVTDCVNLRQREGTAVADYLQRLAAGNR